MRRVSFLALLPAAAAAVAACVVGRSWATNPVPAAKPADDNNPFGDGTDSRPAPSSPPGTAGTTAADDSSPPGLRPDPPAPKPVSPRPPMCSGIGVGGVGYAQNPPPSLRILTPEMAATPEPQEIDTNDSPALIRIKAALQSPTEIACKETPLREVIEQLKKRHNIEIQLDVPALKEAGVAPDCPVTKHLSGISLKSALKLLLDDLQLKYVIHNEALLITSPPKCEFDEYMQTRLYPVKDLILVRNERGEIETDFQPLMDLIDNTLATKTWVENGGTGTITAFQYQDRCLLVVCQAADVHEQIACLLAALRRCSAHDGKSGNPLQLPQRPRAIAPAAARPALCCASAQGGGLF